MSLLRAKLVTNKHWFPYGQCSLTNKPTDQPHIEAAEVIGGS